MGSGSFGGGSGSFGGGSGGGPGGGGGPAGGPGRRGGPGRGGRPSKDQDSAEDRILKLTQLTASVNAHPEIAQVRATIYNLLQDRTRSAFLRVLLSDPMVTTAYKSVFSLGAEIRKGATLASAASKTGASVNAPLAELADHICGRGQAADTDERIESIVQQAVTDLLLRTVNNSQDLYYDAPVASLGTKFAPTPLQNTADIFLGSLIREAVRRDLLNLSREAKAVIGEASHEIALSWTDKFKDKADGVSFRDMLQTIGADYLAYAGGKNE